MVSVDISRATHELHELRSGDWVIVSRVARFNMHLRLVANTRADCSSCDYSGFFEALRTKELLGIYLQRMSTVHLLLLNPCVFLLCF